MVVEWKIRAATFWGLAASTLFVACAGADERTAREVWRSVRTEREVRTERLESEEHLASLDSLISRARVSNPGLGASFEKWTAALARVPQAKSLPDPMLSYAYFLEPVETRVGPQRQRFSVSQRLPLLGKLGAKGDAAVAAANTAAAEYEGSLRELTLRLSRLWNDYYYLAKAIEVTEESVQLLSSVEDVALRRYAAGGPGQMTVIRIQVELGRLENHLLTLRSQQAPIVSAINAELNRAANSPVTWPQSVDADRVRASRDALAAALLDHNPSLLSVAARADEAAAMKRLAGKVSIPDLTLGLQYIETDEARFPGVMDSGKDAVVASASINLPLWFGRNSAVGDEAAARLNAVQGDRAQLRNRLLADLDHALFSLQDAERRLDLYATVLVPKATQSYEVTEDAFASGQSTFTDLIDTQRTLLEFRLSEQRAIADYATARARLEQLVGVDLDELDTPTQEDPR